MHYQMQYRMHRALVEWVVRALVEWVVRALVEWVDQASVEWVDQASALAHQDLHLDHLWVAADHSNWIVLQGLVGPCFLFLFIICYVLYNKMFVPILKNFQ